MLPMACIRPNMNLTMSYPKICMTNLTLVCHQFPKFGSDQVELSSISIKLHSS